VSDSISTYFDIKAALNTLPSQPGVYRMYGKHNELLYIGKAKVLKNRVKSYFQKNSSHTPRIQRMVKQIHHFDYVVTDTEIEALLLEDSLVKTHRPRFNVLLMDDKRYPWLCITDEPYPRLIVVRRISRSAKKSKAKYFGPYISSGNMYETLRIIRKHFPMRQRPKPLFKDRPCMNYAIGTCPGSCQNLISETDYAKTLQQVEWFLKGKTNELLTLIEADMKAASDTLNFEWAAKLRDRYQAVNYVFHYDQGIHIPDPTLNIDAIGLASDGIRVQMVVAKVRNGRIVASTTHQIELTNQLSLEEAYSSFLFLHYQERDADDIPDELVLQCPFQSEKSDEDQAWLLDWLSQRRSQASPHKRKVTLSVPQKGIRKDILDFAANNAQAAVDNARHSDASRLRNDPAKALSTLQTALNLPRYPKRMECYDISHVQGAYTVASMVVFIDGQPSKSHYRKFKIKTAEGSPDDFQSMFEVVTRRFKRSANEVNAQHRWESPDLVIIDGGKGQLSHAVEALTQMGITDQPIISLAKKFEEVYKPNQSRPIILPRDSTALFLLQQIRDESHRFAITYHRQIRGKGAKQSILDDIPGLGPKRKAHLLSVFGSIDELSKATEEKIAKVMPPLVAKALYNKLHSLI